MFKLREQTHGEEYIYRDFQLGCDSDDDNDYGVDLKKNKTTYCTLNAWYNKISC